MNKTVVIQNDCGEQLSVELTLEGDQFLGVVNLDGVAYHVERVSMETLTTRYCVDADPDYIPQHDSRGECVLFAPYSL